MDDKKSTNWPCKQVKKGWNKSKFNQTKIQLPPVTKANKKLPFICKLILTVIAGYKLRKKAINP